MKPTFPLLMALALAMATTGTGAATPPAAAEKPSLEPTGANDLVEYGVDEEGNGVEVKKAVSGTPTHGEIAANVVVVPAKAAPAAKAAAPKAHPAPLPTAPTPPLGDGSFAFSLATPAPEVVEAPTAPADPDDPLADYVRRPDYDGVVAITTEARQRNRNPFDPERIATGVAEEQVINIACVAIAAKGRFVRINGRNLTEGDILFSGITINRIRRDGIVCRAGAMEFFVPVGTPVRLLRNG